MTTDNRLRLTILGGFLGAGKSTWLRHQLFVKTYNQPHVIVNEVAPHAVDDTLLAGACHLDVLAGGCVCCDQRQPMIALLHNICDHRSSSDSDDQLYQLIFEMSGVADPGQVMTAIQDDPILARHIKLEEIVVVVDALHGLQQLQSEPLARLQIEAADRILISKIDACDEAGLGALIATLIQINPAPEICASSFGVEDSMVTIPAAPAAQLPKLGNEVGAPLMSLSLNLDDYDSAGDGDNWVGFSVWLSAMLHAHGDHLVRIKGVVCSPAGRLLLQSVRKVMQAPEMLPIISDADHRTSDNKIALIGRGLDHKQIENSLKHFVSMTKN